MEKINIKDLLDYQIIGDLHQCGDYMITSIEKMNEKTNSYDRDLYYINEDLSLSPLTSSHHVSDFIIEDDTHILFQDTRSKEDEPRKNEKKTVYYRLSLKGGEAIKAFEFKYDVFALKLYSNKQILLIGDQIYENKEKDYVYLTEVPFYINGEGFRDGLRAALMICDPILKQEIKITPAGFDVLDFKIYDHYILYTGIQWKDIMPHKQELYLYDLNNNSNIRLLEPYRIESFVIDDHKIYSMMSDMQEYGTDQYCDLYQYDLENNELKKLLKYEYPIYPSVMSDISPRGGESLQIINHELYLLSTIGYRTLLYHFNGSHMELVFPFDGCITSYLFKGKDLYITGMQEGKLPEIYHYSLSDGHYKLCTQSSFSKVLKNKRVQKPVYIPFINRKGMKIDAWIIFPVDFKADTLYPSLLDIHGGPRGDYGDVFYHEMQVWANEGYFVYYCNPQGSDGYGQDFGDMRGQYGKKDFDDFLDFIEYIKTNFKSIDTNRMGVTGGSYGGFMTNYLITHTHLFQAAATQRSISDWVSDYGTSGISYNDGLFFGARPWQGFEEMWEASPLKYASNCITPTLFIHSFEDYTCAISQAYELFTAFKVLGIDTKAVLFKGENHGLSRRGKPTHRFKRLEEITNWMNDHLKEVL